MIQIMSNLKNMRQKIFASISYQKPDVGWSEVYLTGAHFDMKIEGCFHLFSLNVLYFGSLSFFYWQKLDFPLA